MGSGSPVRLRCPDCSKSAGPFNGRPACPGCGRVFEPADGVWNLLPSSLDAVKSNEDEAHVDAGAPTWRRLFLHKRYWVEWCDTRWLPELVDGRTRRARSARSTACWRRVADISALSAPLHGSRHSPPPRRAHSTPGH